MLLLHHAEWHSVVYNDLKGTLILILLRYDTLCLCPPLLYSVTVTGVCPCSHADTVGGLFVPVSTTHYLERSQVETFDSTDQLG